MYTPEYEYNTIKEAQIEILKIILNEGENIEETAEINNIFVTIKTPLKDTYVLFENVTKISEKHMNQMMLEPNPNLDKTFHGRLHNYVVGDKKKHEIGENLISYDQIEEVIKRLKENPFSKRAVLTLWSPNDTNDKYAPPWISSQLMIRENKLIITSYFRSLDIWNGFPYNCVGIANLQVEIAKKLGIESGKFILFVGSCHVYKSNINEINKYLQTQN